MARPSTTPNVRSISGLRNVRHRGGRWTRAERLSDANEPPFQIDRTKNCSCRELEGTAGGRCLLVIYRAGSSPWPAVGPRFVIAQGSSQKP